MMNFINQIVNLDQGRLQLPPIYNSLWSCDVDQSTSEPSHDSNWLTISVDKALVDTRWKLHRFPI